jgi:hypothetical protein
MTEVKLGELASTSGVRDDVKSFGQMMVKDHTAINDDLMAGGLRIQRLTSAQPIHMVASILSSWCH